MYSSALVNPDRMRTVIGTPIMTVLWKKEGSKEKARERERKGGGGGVGKKKEKKKNKGKRKRKKEKKGEQKGTREGGRLVG